jgi:predicted transcriptional regulator
LSKLKQEEPSLESNVISNESSQPSAELSLDTLNASELVSTFQKIKTEEQKLTEQKQELSFKEKDLRRKIMEEIAKKQKAIQELKVEIQSLQDGCYNLTQALCADLSTNLPSSN